MRIAIIMMLCLRSHEYNGNNGPVLISCVSRCALVIVRSVAFVVLLVMVFIFGQSDKCGTHFISVHFSLVMSTRFVSDRLIFTICFPFTAEAKEREKGKNSKKGKSPIVNGITEIISELELLKCFTKAHYYGH